MSRRRAIPSLSCRPCPWPRPLQSGRRTLRRLDLALTAFAVLWLLARFTLFALRRSG